MGGLGFGMLPPFLDNQAEKKIKLATKIVFLKGFTGTSGSEDWRTFLGSSIAKSIVHCDLSWGPQFWKPPCVGG